MPRLLDVGKAHTYIMELAPDELHEEAAALRLARAAAGGGLKLTDPSEGRVNPESMRLGDFTEAEVRALLAQHTTETGQAFTPAALDAVWRQTRGQPWLVNALCH